MASSGEIPAHGGPRAVRRGAGWRIGRALLAALGLAALLVAAGAAYEAASAPGDAARFPPPGQLVDVGGYRMHLHCVGQGSPTVVLASGAGGFSAEWSQVQQELARTTRACAFDRAGLGWSDPGPEPRTPGQIAAELDTLLSRAGVEGPLVLVAHSAGGKHVRLFAQRRPQDVVGLVLVDTRSEYVEDRQTPEEAAAELRGTAEFYQLIGRARALGLVRLAWAELWPAALPVTAKLSPELRHLLGIIQSRPGHIATALAENEAAAADNDALRNASLGDTPLVLLGAGQTIANIPSWRGSLEYQAGLSSDSRLTTVADADHSLHWDHPELVVSAVQELVGAGR